MPRLSCRNKEYCTKRPHQLITDENISNIVLRSVDLAQSLMICVFLIIIIKYITNVLKVKKKLNFAIFHEYISYFKFNQGFISMIWTYF